VRGPWTSPPFGRLFFENVIPKTGDFSVIYFIQDETLNLIKIGFTDADDATPRLRALQTGNPSVLVLLITMLGSKEIEAQLHTRFASARERGEWFRPVPELMRFLLQVAAIPHRQWGRLVCPVCESRRNHIFSLSSYRADDNHPDRDLEHVRISFLCENDHDWSITFHSNVFEQESNVLIDFVTPEEMATIAQGDQS
jgi:hypothetical protein